MQASRSSITVGQYSRAGRKERNDDSWGVLVPTGPELVSKGIAMAIADGVSASDDAKAASETCVKSFLEDYYATHESWTVKKSVALVLKAVNNWLHAQGQATAGRGMASTFSGVVLKAGMAHIFHVGDSRIGLLRDGALEPLTRDHRARAGLSRAIGANPDLEIDYRAEAVQAGDVLIFTTDGVHDHLSPSRMANMMKVSPDSLDEAARVIVEQALKSGSDDNVTCQIVRVESPGRPDAASHLAALTALPFPPDLALGMTFEGFRIVRELHASKRTQVYLAEDTQTGEATVLKTPSVNYEDDPAYLEMWTREEWIGRLIASPHVLKVVAPTRARRFLYYVTEFFDGQTLRQWMLDNPKPGLETVRAITGQIAKGLRAFHRKDIIHQDLKPENVMIDRHGLVKIIDFGSSRAASLAEASSPVDTPALAGTLDYAAPEYHKGEPGSNRSDIFSLGVIAYEMLTGRLPYGKGFANVRDLAKRDYTPARSIRDDIPIWVDATLAKAVEKRPSERTDALSAFVEDFARPNPALGYDRRRPLIERDPLTFWRSIAGLLFLSNLVLLFLLSGTR